MYYLVYGGLYLISLLPLRILYLFSDLAYVVLYKIIRYRKKVVLQNLAIAFPHKTEEEKIKIAKQFYRNLCDTFIETVKLISADKAFIVTHCSGDLSIVNAIYKTGRPVQVHLGHNFNWELANFSTRFSTGYKMLVMYLPLKNKAINRLFFTIRSRFGINPVDATNMKKDLQPHFRTQYLMGLLADQSPPGPKEAYWVLFFNRPTAFLRGPERAARRNNAPVVFFHFTKQKRGYYTVHIHLATMEPRLLPEGELTKQYARFLEKVMARHPEMWLWSHRRWKHVWKEEYGPVII